MGEISQNLSSAAVLIQGRRHVLKSGPAEEAIKCQRHAGGGGGGGGST